MSQWCQCGYAFLSFLFFFAWIMAKEAVLSSLGSVCLLGKSLKNGSERSLWKYMYVEKKYAMSHLWVLSPSDESEEAHRTLGLALKHPLSIVHKELKFRKLYPAAFRLSVSEISPGNELEAQLLLVKFRYLPWSFPDNDAQRFCDQRPDCIGEDDGRKT